MKIQPSQTQKTYPNLPKATSSMTSAIKYGATCGLLLLGGAAARMQNQAPVTPVALPLPSGVRVGPPRELAAVAGLDAQVPTWAAPNPNASATAVSVRAPDRSDWFTLAVYFEPRSALRQFDVLDAKNGKGPLVLAPHRAAAASQIFNLVSSQMFNLNGSEISNVNSSQVSASKADLCLDVLGAKFSEGAAVDMWPCLNDAANQKWDITLEASGFHSVKPADKNLCLSVANKNAGVQLLNCDNDLNRQWRVSLSP